MTTVETGKVMGEANCGDHPRDINYIVNRRMNLSIIIPLLNERESLKPLCDAIVPVLDARGGSYEIIFVDDGSTDGSFDVIRTLREAHGQKVRAFRFNRNYGKAAALSVGIAGAKGEVIVTMDADLQDDPSAIPGMLSLLGEGWDLVSGWKKVRHDPLFTKNLPSRFFNWFTARVSGLSIHDFNCGFKAYRAGVAKALDIYGERHRYLPALAHWEGYRVTEIEVTHHPRTFGRTKYGVSRFINGPMDILTLLFLRRYLRSPLHFFGFVGALLIFAGAMVLGYFGIEWLVTGAMRIRPLTLLSVGAVIVGIQFLSFGFLAEMLTHVSPKSEYKIRDFID